MSNSPSNLPIAPKHKCFVLLKCTPRDFFGQLMCATNRWQAQLGLVVSATLNNICILSNFIVLIMNMTHKQHWKQIHARLQVAGLRQVMKWVRARGILLETAIKLIKCIHKVINRNGFFIVFNSTLKELVWSRVCRRNASSVRMAAFRTGRDCQLSFMSPA